MTTPVVAERRALKDERDFLLGSLRDLDVERDAGDLSEEDYAALRDRYTARAAGVLRALAAFGDTAPGDTASGDTAPGDTAPGDTAPGDGVGPADAPLCDDDIGSGPHDGVGRRRRDRRRRLAVIGAVAVFAAAAVVGVVTVTRSRLPGATATGSLTLGRAQEVQRQLAQAAVLETSGDPIAALRLYRQVLAGDPTQPQALAESGWLVFQAGVQAKSSAVVAAGQRQEQAAVRADPGAYGPHLYLGSMLLVEGDAMGAVSEFRTYLGDDPPASSVAGAAAFITRAFTQAGLAPPALPGA